jgi:Kinesin motor domain
VKQIDCTTDVLGVPTPLIRVALRIRPAPAAGVSSTAAAVPRKRVVVPPRGPGSVTNLLDVVLGPTCCSYTCYNVLCAPSMSRFLAGHSCTVLSYGAASSGKSHTLLGGSGGGGMVSHAICTAFEELCNVPKSHYCLSLRACMLSVAPHATLIDLLAPGGATASCSLRDGCATAALSALTEWKMEQASDAASLLRKLRQQNGVLASGAHLMLSLVLERSDNNGRCALTFVELAAPDPRVG